MGWKCKCYKYINDNIYSSRWELAVSSNSDEKIAKVYPKVTNGEISLSYIIGGNTYFKLRDVGMVIDFEVTYDNATKT